jgi:tRNA(fMet)-specific endonuclease VapC
LIVADTDVLIDALNGIEPYETTVRNLLRARRLATTAPSRFELETGAVEEEEATRAAELFETLLALPFDAEAAERAAAVARHLRKSGTPIPMADLAIAGICLIHDAPLFTRNRKHFERVAGLRLVDPHHPSPSISE